MSDVTHLLEAVQRGDAYAAEELLPLVYEELRKLAAARMASEPDGHTLQPTALVHEVWLRLTGNKSDAQFANRAHFFAAAAESMRRILIERARRKSAEKRGAGRERVDLDKVELATDTDHDTLLLVNESLEKLGKEDANAAKIVTLRFFGGLTLEEAGQVLGVTERTAKRYDAVSFSATSDSLPGARSFTSLAACADEIGMSRIYGGIHFQFDNAEGKRCGQLIGNYVSANFLLPNDQLPAVRIEGFSNSAPIVRMHGRIGKNCILEASPDFRSWQPIATNSAVPGGCVICDEAAGSTPSRFYRVKEQ